MTQAVIQLEQLTRHFGELVAVDGVSFEVAGGAIFGLLGPNGSGKSTIIRMLCGVLPPTAGSARVLGFDVRRQPEAIKHFIGYMSQSFSLYTDLSVRENLRFYARIYGLPPARVEQRTEAVLELTGLTDRLDQLAETLSGGWKQRLALACALIHEPRVIFLDEPTAGIDPVARRQLWDLLFELSGRGITLLVTTHYMDEAARCSDVGYIHQSRLLLWGKPDALKRLSEVTPEGTCRYELEVPSPVERLARLRALGAVRDATLFGETIHVQVQRTLSPAALLEAIGAPADRSQVRPITPTLEDVFVTITGQAERRRAEGRPPPPTVRAGVGQDLRAGRGGAPAAGAVAPPRRARPLAGMPAVLIKEFVHIRRQPTTIFFMLVVPVMQTLIFGFAINTQIEHIPLVVFDLDGRQAGRALVDDFVNTRRFDVAARVHDEDSFRRALSSGRAKVGLRIPPDYTERLLRGEQVAVQVLIDGSDSQVATTALHSSSLLGLQRSLRLARVQADARNIGPARNATGRVVPPIDVRPRLLYNPDLKSAHFFVPGLVGIILQLVTVFLTSFAVVRERERGTLEQLFVTPVGRAGLLLGKLIPYATVGFLETLVVLTVMVYVFGVPIHGSLPLLLALALLFLVCSLGLGLLVSTLARTQLAAVQFAFIIMLPSVLLSGFMFPRAEMPGPIYVLTFAIPVTYFIEILRGIVLRSADLADLVPWITALAAAAVIVLTLSVVRFRKQLA